MKKLAALFAAIQLATFAAAQAADAPASSTNSQAQSDYTITLKDHVWSPTELVVPAGQKVKVTVKNLGDKPAEFESATLNREKVVTPHGEITVFVGPLDAGHYSYVNDFDHATTGTITAK